MIRYATPKTQNQILEMWKICFGNSMPYTDIYFREKYKNENTLVYFEGDKAVASLQLLHFKFTFCDTEIPVAYISGACTLPEARQKGYMAKLIERTLQEIGKRNIPLTLLVPQEEWLLSFYGKFGYAQTFEAGHDLVSLEELITQYPDNLHEAYVKFDSCFRTEEMTVQKTFDDFRVIVEEAAAYDYLPKKSLMGMARVIDAKSMLGLFASKYADRSFSLELQDPILPQNNQFFTINGGNVTVDGAILPLHLSLSIYDLAQALLGYHTTEKQNLFKGIFPEHLPQIHFMLE